MNYSKAESEMLLGLLPTGKGRRVQDHETSVATDNSEVVSTLSSQSSRNHGK